jgi:hypothetical protein
VAESLEKCNASWKQIIAPDYEKQKKEERCVLPKMIR